MSRLAIFVPSLRGGGAERMMMTLANRFVERGHSVDLVLVKAEGPYLAEVAPQVRVIDLNAPRTLSALPALARYLRRERPKALLAAMLHANVVAVFARMLARVPTRIVISERNTTSRDLATLSRPMAIVMKLAMKLAYPRADGITAVSTRVADDLSRTIGIARERIQVVYNPVYSDELAQAAQQDPHDPWLPASGKPDIPVILSAGRLNAQKDFATLIDAFALILKQRPARLLILGEGELRSALEAQIAALNLQDSARLAGFQTNPFAFMARCAVFALSSRWEGLPGVLIQAMGCGARVVATDCAGGSAEILENGKWGRLVPVRDAQALAQAIMDTLDDPAPPDVLSRARSFDADTATERYLAVLG